MKNVNVNDKKKEQTKPKIKTNKIQKFNLYTQPKPGKIFPHIRCRYGILCK